MYNVEIFNQIKEEYFMYYKVNLRIIDKYYNEGYVRIGKEEFEGFLTYDYIKGKVREVEGQKFLYVEVIAKAFETYEISKLNIRFQIDEFYIPEIYKAIITVCYYYDNGLNYSFLTEIQLDFLEKVEEVKDFEKNLEEVKEKLEL